MPKLVTLYTIQSQKVVTYSSDELRYRVVDLNELTPIHEFNEYAEIKDISVPIHCIRTQNGSHYNDQFIAMSYELRSLLEMPILAKQEELERELKLTKDQHHKTLNEYVRRIHEFTELPWYKRIIAAFQNKL